MMRLRMERNRLFILGMIILGISLMWEFSHYRLYMDMTGIPSTLHLIIASFTDLILISFIFLFISIFRKGRRWIENPQKLDYIFIILLGMIISTIIEIYSLSKGRWAYTELMPTFFGIGISPLIQLFTTAIIGLWLLKKLR